MLSVCPAVHNSIFSLSVIDLLPVLKRMPWKVSVCLLMRAGRMTITQCQSASSATRLASRVSRALLRSVEVTKVQVSRSRQRSVSQISARLVTRTILFLPFVSVLRALPSIVVQLVYTVSLIFSEFSTHPLLLTLLVRTAKCVSIHYESQIWSCLLKVILTHRSVTSIPS